LPDLDSILSGTSKSKFPAEPSADAEWLQFFVTSLFPMLRDNGQMASTFKRMSADPELIKITAQIRDLLLSY